MQDALPRKQNPAWKAILKHPTGNPQPRASPAKEGLLCQVGLIHSQLRVQTHTTFGAWPAVAKSTQT